MRWATYSGAPLRDERFYILHYHACRPHPGKSTASSDLRGTDGRGAWTEYKSRSMQGRALTPEAPEARWYPVCTRCRCEARVERRTREAAEETLLPLIRRARQWSDRKKTVPFPMFAGYLFVRSKLQGLGQLLAVPGRVAGPSGYPTPIRDEEVEALRRMVEGASGLEVEPEPISRFEFGEEVIVTGGPFKGMRGHVVHSGGRARVGVWLAVLAQARAVDVMGAVVQRLE